MKPEEKILLAAGSGLMIGFLLTNPNVQKFILEMLKELKEGSKTPCIFEEHLCVKKPKKLLKP